MDDALKKNLSTMDVGSLLEMKKALDREIAAKALKTMDKEMLEALDSDPRLASVDSLAAKMDML